MPEPLSIGIALGKMAGVPHRFSRGMDDRFLRHGAADRAHRAGLLAPEIDAGIGEVIVRFRPTKYVAPERIGHDLSPLQRQLPQVLAHLGACSLSEVMGQMPAGTSQRTVQDNLRLLLQLDLVDLRGERRWARWILKGTSP